MLNSVCKVPVILEIKNNSFPGKISFKIEIFNSDEAVNSKSELNYPFFLWEGIIDKDITDLDQNVVFIKFLSIYFRKP